MAYELFNRDYNLQPRPVHLFHYFFRFICRAVFTLYFRGKVYGREYLTKEGGGILAVNHASFLDPPLAGQGWPRPLYYMARDTLLGGGWLTWMMNVSRTIPVRRGTNDIRALRRVVSAIKGKDVVVLFPEGTRTQDGQLQPGRAGAGMIAYKARAHIFPCYVEGSWGVWPRNQKFPKPGKIRIFYGKPYLPEELYNQKSSREVYEAISQGIMDRIALLKKESENLKKK